jgi:hypothetical protein
MVCYEEEQPDGKLMQYLKPGVGYADDPFCPEDG